MMYDMIVVYDDDDDDDPTIVDSSGIEHGFCNVGTKIVPLSKLGWDGVCRECAECDDDGDTNVDNGGSL